MRVGRGRRAGRAPAGRAARSSAPAPSRLCAEEAVDQRREDREDVDPHVRLQFTRTGRRAGRRRPDPSATGHDEAHRARARRRRARADRSPGSRRPRSRARAAARRRRPRSTPTRSCTHSASGSSSGSARQHDAVQALRGRRGRRRRRSARRSRPGAAATTRPARSPRSVVEHRAGRDSFEPVRDEVDDDVTAEPVRPSDRADLEQGSGHAQSASAGQSTKSTSTSTPSRTAAARVDGADGVRGAAALADHAAHVAGSDAHPQADARAGPRPRRPRPRRDRRRGPARGSRGRRVPSRPGCGSHRRRRRPSSSASSSSLELVVELVFDLVVVEDVVALRSRVTHFAALAAWNSSHAPEIFSSFSTRSVGCAPLRSQSTAFALSIFTTDGSARGS